METNLSKNDHLWRSLWGLGWDLSVCSSDLESQGWKVKGIPRSFEIQREGLRTLLFIQSISSNKERSESFLIFVMKSGGDPQLVKKFYSGFLTSYKKLEWTFWPTQCMQFINIYWVTQRYWTSFFLSYENDGFHVNESNTTLGVSTHISYCYRSKGFDHTLKPVLLYPVIASSNQTLSPGVGTSSF